MEAVFQQFIDFLSGLFPDISKRGRRLLFIGFIISVISILVILETQVHWLEFWFLQRKVALLQELTILEQDNVLQNTKIADAYHDIAVEIENLEYFPARSLSLSIFKSDQFWKFVGAGLIGFIFAGYGFASRQTSMALGALVFGLIFAIPGLLIPTIHKVWVNIIIYVVVESIILLLISKR